jgi:hypothetical protein
MEMPSTFEEFLKTKSIDPRRVIATSSKLEKLRREDRSIKLAQRQARKSEDAKKKDEKGKKPRSGRPVTQRAIDAAMTGKPLSGPTKQRILRAVNQILTQKKQEPIALPMLFPGEKKMAA